MGKFYLYSPFFGTCEDQPGLEPFLEQIVYVVYVHILYVHRRKGLEIYGNI